MVFSYQTFWLLDAERVPWVVFEAANDSLLVVVEELRKVVLAWSGGIIL